MLIIYICTNVINLYFWSTFNYVGEKKRFFFLLLVLSVISLVRPLIFKWCWFDVMRPSILGQDTNPQRRSSKSINNRCVFLMWYKRCISIFLFVFCLKSKSREKKREREDERGRVHRGIWKRIKEMDWTNGVCLWARCQRWRSSPTAWRRPGDLKTNRAEPGYCDGIEECHTCYQWGACVFTKVKASWRRSESPPCVSDCSSAAASAALMMSPVRSEVRARS